MKITSTTNYLLFGLVTVSMISIFTYTPKYYSQWTKKSKENYLKKKKNETSKFIQKVYSIHFWSFSFEFFYAT